MTDIEVFAEERSWADACAAHLVDSLAVALAETGRAMFAGSGGSTPGPVYRRIARADIDWSSVVITLVDERAVPPASAESNQTLIRRELMSGAAAASTFVPLFASAVTIDRSAALATRALKALGGRLDTVLLGMGEDGHICSMFPGSPTLKTLLAPDLKPAIYGVPQGRDGMAPSLQRLSMNLPWLITARRIVLAFTGSDKRAVFEREASGDPRTHPIAALIDAQAPIQVCWTETSNG